MRTAFILGGTGFAGRHIARRLADTGWDVTVAARGVTPSPTEVVGIRHVALDRSEPGALADALRSRIDVLIDVIPYNIEDAEEILSVRGLVGSIVAISTTSVYTDGQGRTMDEATSEATSPEMPVPIFETQPTVAPGDATYSSRKAAIEQLLLGQDDVPATIIRPCAIYGPGDTQCREWFFIKRALDGRERVLLADKGDNVFHTTSVHNLAELARLGAEQPGTRVLNCGDPDPPDVRHIARSIAAAIGHDWDEVLIPQELSRDRALRNPWASFHPWVVSMDKAARELGYEPVIGYDDAIVKTVHWVLDAIKGRDWKEVLPRAAEYLGRKFDYDAEDEFIHER